MKKKVMTLKSMVVFFAVALFLFGVNIGSQAQSAGTGNENCAKLEDLYLPNTVIINTCMVPAAGDLPEYCRVTGYVLPANHFEVRLPTHSWNEKFYMAGCGGYCGSVMDRPGFTNAMNYGLLRKYAVATTDMGHWGKSMFDGTWAYNARQQEIDFGYRGTHEVTQAAKAIIKAYYGKGPVHSYFAGCSNGGRQALMEAQRYPEDYDGIICGAPALDWTGLVGIHACWIIQANTGKDGKPIIDWDDLALISKAVYERCDQKDGLKDGIVVDPRECDFDPESLLCKGDQKEGCLTAEQVNALKKMYGGAKDSKGNQIYAGGLAMGSETFWGLWVIGGKPGPYGGILPALMSMLADDHIRYTAFETDCPSCTPLGFNFDTDPEKMAYMAKLLNATSPDLKKFNAKGGKMIMYQGWADPAVTPLRTVEYYEGVIKEMGGLEQTQRFCRLYMVPGMAHCNIPPGVGPDQFDLLKPLEDWVEKGIAPEQIAASQTDKEGKVTRTRPLYPYPQVSVYKGSGDVNDAVNFSFSQ